MTAADRVTRLWDAFEARGAIATLDHVHDDCEWVPSPELAMERMQGAAAIRGYLEELRRSGVRIEPSLHSCEAAGDVVVVCGRMRVVSPATLSDSPLYWVYRVRGERVARIESYACRRDAYAAAAH